MNTIWLGIIILLITISPVYAAQDDGTYNYIHSRGSGGRDNLTDNKIVLQNIIIDNTVEGKVTKIHIFIKNIGETINDTNATLHIDNMEVQNVSIPTLLSNSLWNHTFSWNGSRGEHRVSIYIGTTLIVSNRITYVNGLPAIVINADENANVGDSIRFSAEDTVDPDGDALTFSWNFGDGNKAPGAKVKHTYISPGEYMVILTVTDARGGVNNTTRMIKISPPATPSLMHFIPYILIAFFIIIIAVSVIVLKRRGKKKRDIKKVLPVDVEKSQKPEKEIKDIQEKDVNTVIHRAEEWVNAIKLEGFDLPGAGVVLTSAKDFKTLGAYDKAIWYAKESERIAKEIKSNSITRVRMDTIESIERSEEIIKYIKGKGIDVILSERFIARAKESLEKEEYDRATGYAKKAKKLAQEMEMRYAIDGRSLEQELIVVAHANHLKKIESKSTKVIVEDIQTKELDKVPSKQVTVDVMGHVKEFEEEIERGDEGVEEPTKELVECPVCGKSISKVWRICPYCDAFMDTGKTIEEDIMIVDEEIQTLEMISKAKIHVRNIEKAQGVYVPVAERYIKRAELAYSNKNFEKAKKWAMDAMKTIDENI